MKVLNAVLHALLLHVIRGSDDHYEVPEPTFEVFSPKGLKISFPDSTDVKSVEFFINLPTCPEPLIQEVNYTKDGNYVYWNPEVVLRLYDKLRYKLMIRRKDVYWKKEGTHVVQKVLPLKNETECTENQNQKIIAGFSGFSGLEERNKPMIATGKASNYKSSYSTQKTGDLKPITKSSMSTTSGTFFIKPSGVMEATGYKKGSSFDSTKREGQQWEHFQSELTAEELEKMKNLYDSGFRDFPLMHTDLFSASSPKIYEKRYMTSQSKSFPSASPSLRYATHADSQPPITHKFHETHQAHKTSSFTHSQPVFQFAESDARSAFTDFNPNSQTFFRAETPTILPNPLPPQGTIFKATEYVRQEHTVPMSDVSILHVDGDAPKASNPQKIIQMSHSGELSSRNQELVKPAYASVAGVGARADQTVYTAGNLQSAERQDFESRHYTGNIFTSSKMTKVKSPQECSLLPGVDYTPTANMRDLERNLQELRCLATLAESLMKEEFALLKQKNSELNRKVELMEHEVKRISKTCNCYE